MADNENQGVDEEKETPSDGSASNELRKLQIEKDELRDRLARVTADFQNSRRRLEADAEQRLQYANSSLIKALIPVIDNFERALAVDPAKVDAASIHKGLQMVHDQWLAVLKKENVEAVAPEPGTAFDPTLHEAVMQEASEKYDEPTVTQLLTKGYTLHGRTLRPASVAVSRQA